MSALTTDLHRVHTQHILCTASHMAANLWIRTDDMKPAVATSWAILTY